MPRPMLVLLIVLAGTAFLAASFALARVLSANGAERSAATAIVRAQVLGNAEEAVERLEGCTGACADAVRALVARYGRGTEPDILNVEAGGFTLGSRKDAVRVAWATPGDDPVVQCVYVQRSGSVLDGFRVRAVRLSPSIGNEAECP